MRFRRQWKRRVERREHRRIAAEAAGWTLLICLVIAAWAVVCATLQGCAPEFGITVDEGLTVFIHWPAVNSLLPSNTAAVRITVTAADLAAPIVVDIPRPALPGDQRVSIEVPAGGDRTVTAEAFDVSGHLLGRDSLGGVVVRPGETTDVTLELLTNGTLSIHIE